MGRLRDRPHGVPGFLAEAGANDVLAGFLKGAPQAPKSTCACCESLRPSSGRGGGKAQGVLGISPHIANLDRRLIVRLCNRGAQGFSLAPQGQEVLTETDRMLDHLNANRLNAIGKHV